MRKHIGYNILYESGKGKRKSNRYTINFHKIEKRQTEKRQTGSENDLLNESQRSESDLSIGRNATTNDKHINNTHADAALSSSIIEQSIPDEDAPQNDGLYLGRGRHKPIGLQRAKNVVTAWLQAEGKEMYPNLDDEHRERLIEVLSNVISLYTEPPKVGPKDIENILDTLTKRSDWVIVEDTIENVKDQACMQQIDNPRAYILSAIKKNIEVGTAVREW